MAPGLTLKMTMRPTQTHSSRNGNLKYSDSMFNKLIRDVTEILNDDALYCQSNYIEYIKNNVYFNGESTLGIDIVQSLVLTDMQGL